MCIEVLDRRGSEVGPRGSGPKPSKFYKIVKLVIT